ncbi:MAG TPA: hypothetical protein VF458_07525 [Ktedonobacteraceae bacterium]
MEIIEHLMQLTALAAMDAEGKPRAIIVCTPEEIQKSLTVLFDAYEASEVYQTNLTLQADGPWRMFTRDSNGVIAEEMLNQQIFQQCFAPQPRQGSAKSEPKK